MKTVLWTIAVLAALGLGACASSQGGSGDARALPANFDPSACYEREFDVYFNEFDTELTPEAQEAIGAVARSLEGCRVTGVGILGLTDSQGSFEENRTLSERRAEVIANYLTANTSWPRRAYDLRRAGERGATTAEGLERPMRRRGHVTVTAVAPNA